MGMTSAGLNDGSRASAARAASAGGHEEHPSEVNSSTRTWGRGSATARAGPSAARASRERIRRPSGDVTGGGHDPPERDGEQPHRQPGQRVETEEVGAAAIGAVPLKDE